MPKKDYCYTTDTRLAAALLAIGIPMPAEAAPLHRYSESGDRITWFFESSDPQGKYETEELIRAWKNPEWFGENADDHPFAFCIAAALNHMKLVDYLKSSIPFVQLTKGETMVLAREGSTLYNDAVDNGFQPKAQPKQLEAQ